jgi:AcrR family transcriptional regulator
MTSSLQIASPASPRIANRQNRTRERIIRESAKLFLARGFDNVSVDHIVAASDIARSSFYRFFPNRNEVLASIIRPVFETGIAMMRDIAEEPAAQVMDGLFDMYLKLWAAGPEALRLATRMGAYFNLFEDVHTSYRATLTDLLRRVQGTGMLLNDSADYSARLIARSAVPILEVYRDDSRLEFLFRRTISGLLLRPEATS